MNTIQSRPSGCTMCEYTKHYWIYTGCRDPGAHYFKTTIDGRPERRCQDQPHERYIVVDDECPLCTE